MHRESRWGRPARGAGRHGSRSLEGGRVGQISQISPISNGCEISRLALISLSLMLAGVLGGCEKLEPRGETPDEAEAIQFTPDVGEEIPGLWRPAGLAASAERNTIFVAEQASRRVRAIDLDTLDALDDPNAPNAETITTVLDASGRRASIPTFDEARWGLGWGLELTWLGAEHLVLAGLGRPLLVLDPDGVDAPVEVGRPAGEGVTPQSGVSLDAVDMATLHGFAIAPDASAAVLVLGARVWRAELDAPTPSALGRAELQLVAGTGASVRGPDVGDAESVGLELDARFWAAALVDERDVLFAERDRLRVVRDGRIVTVTGTGSRSGFKAFELDEWGSAWARAPSVHATWVDAQVPGIENGIYITDNTVLRRIDVETLDTETGEVSGTVAAASQAIPELRGVTTRADRVLLAFALGGSLLETFPQSEMLDLESVFGPLSEWRARYEFDDEAHEAFRLDGLLAPQGVVALAGGELLLANQPLARIVTGVHRAVRPSPEMESRCTLEANVRGHDLCPIWSDGSANGLGIGTMASDNRQLLFGIQAGRIIQFDVVDGFATVLTTLVAPTASGIPGPGLDVVLESSFDVFASSDVIVLHMPGLVVHYDPASGDIRHETGPPSGFTALREGIEPPFFSLDLREASAFDAASGGVRLAAVPDPAMMMNAGALLAAGYDGDRERVDVAGKSVRSGRYTRILGGGTGALTPGASASSVSIEAIDDVQFLGRASSMAGLRAVAALRAPDASEMVEPRLVLLDRDRKVWPLEGVCGVLPFVPGWFGFPGATADVWPPNVVLARPADDSGDQGVYACAPGGEAWVAGREISDAWIPLDDVAPALEPAVSDEALFWIDDGRLQRAPLGTDPGQETGVELDTPDGATIEALGVQPSEAGVYIAARTGDDERLLLTGGWPSSLPPGDPAALPALDVVAGGGTGIVSGRTVSAAMLGERVDAMAVGPGGDLAVVLSDTETIWRVRSGPDGALEADDIAELIVLGGEVFASDADDGRRSVTIDDEGSIWVGAGDVVYRVDDDGEVVPMVGGGTSRPRDGISGRAAALGAVHGVVAVDGHIYVLGSNALVDLDRSAAEAAGTLRVVAGSADGAIHLEDGTRRRLGDRYVVGPIMSPGRTGELVIAWPETHEIISIAVQETE